jgi:polyhydroxyalkanoate synthesis regulator phasin
MIREAYDIKDDLDGLEIVRGLSPHAQEMEDKVSELHDVVKKTGGALILETRRLADELLRAQEAQQKEEAKATTHYNDHQGEYYDSALRDMTDKGIPFEANNSPKESDQEHSPA